MTGRRLKQEAAIVAAAIHGNSSSTALDGLVWLAGAGRSGTTWLGKIFDASPRVLYRHEPDNVKKLPWFRSVPSRIDPDRDEPELMAAFTRAVEESTTHEAAHFVRPPYFRKDYRGPILTGLGRALRSASRFGGSPRLRVPRWMYRGDPAEMRPVIKSVASNLKLAWLHRHFPGIRLVLILRHPGGYLASWLRGAEEGWVMGTRERLDPTVLPFPRPEHAGLLSRYENGSAFERELVYWVIANETPILQLAGTASLHVIVYEDLCEDPEAVARAAFDYCELPFDPAVAEFVRASTARHEEGFHAVFKDPLRTAWAWREELDVAQREVVSEVLSATSLAPLWEDRK